MSWLPTFRNSLSFPPSKVQQTKQMSWTALHLKFGPIGYHETSLNGCQTTLRNIPEERKSHWYHVGTHKITHNLFLVFLRILLAQFQGTNPDTDWTGDGLVTSAILDAFENRRLSLVPVTNWTKTPRPSTPLPRHYKHCNMNPDYWPPCTTFGKMICNCDVTFLCMTYIWTYSRSGNVTIRNCILQGVMLQIFNP